MKSRVCASWDGARWGARAREVRAPESSEPIVDPALRADERTSNQRHRSITSWASCERRGADDPKCNDIHLKTWKRVSFAQPLRSLSIPVLSVASLY